MGPTDEDLATAANIRIATKRLASRVAASSSGKMNPRDTPWHEAAELAQAATSAAWCLGWLLDEVKRLREYETLYNELDASTAPIESHQ